MSFFAELRRRNVVRVALAYGVVSWLALQVADVMIDNIGAPEWVFRSLLVALVVGFPVVLVMAWAFELTPEGIKREKQVDRTTSITRQTGRRLDRMIIAILVVVVAWFVFDEFYLEPGEVVQEPADTAAIAEIETPSIAVLPFLNMSGNKENEYFSDGLTETLLHMLAQLPDLRVAARTSSFAFKESDAGIAEVAETLNVAHVLEGSVQRSDNQVRVTAQLIRASDGFHVWSQNYTRPLNDIFAIQDEIAADVVAALDVSLLGSDAAICHVETSNFDAYETYLRAMEQQALFSYGSLALAEGLFKQALALDPDFLDARIGLARNYLMMESTGLIDQNTMYSMLQPVLAQVREVQPNNRTAQLFEAMAELQANQDNFGTLPLEQIETILRILPLTPTETYARGYAAFSTAIMIRDFDLAHEVIDAGLMIDPLSSFLHRINGDIYKLQKQWPEALAATERALELSPNDGNVLWRLSDLARETNDVVGQLDWMRQAVEADPQDHELASNLARDLYAIGFVEEADRWASRVSAIAPTEPHNLLLQMQSARGRGQTDLALELAQQMIADQVTGRQGIFFAAGAAYRLMMAEEGRAREGYDFLLSTRPELQDFGAPGIDIKGRDMQWSAINLMSIYSDPAETRARWIELTDALTAAGIPWMQFDSFVRAEDHLLRGEHEQAVDWFLSETLNEPLTTQPDIIKELRSPIYSSITDDPRVAARLAELERDLEGMRSLVRDMLEEPEWNQ